MKHKILLIYTWFVRIILFPLPDIPFIMRFRGFLYSFGMRSCGDDFQVTHDANIKCLENLDVGNNCYIANGCTLICHGLIILEDEVQLGPNVVVVSGNHTARNNSFRFGHGIPGTIILCMGSWVGANSTILAHSILPRGSVLGANSVLNKKFEDVNSLYAGVPARKKISK